MKPKGWHYTWKEISVEDAILRWNDEGIFAFSCYEESEHQLNYTETECPSKEDLEEYDYLFIEVENNTKTNTEITC